MKNKEEKDSKMEYLGFDVGTGTLIASKLIENDKIKISQMRNAFHPLSKEDLSYVKLADSKMDYVERLDDKGFPDLSAIIGEDAMKFGAMYNIEPKRPMKDGIISPQDIDSVDVINMMIEKLCNKSKNGFCTYSFPAQPVDRKIASTNYHKQFFGNVFKKLGYEATPLNEGMAIIYSECEKENFSGISFSFGSGLTNVAVAYKNIPVLQFSVGRGGDWIDQNSAESVGTIPSRARLIKENNLDLLNITSSNRKEQVVKEAIVFYYRSLIEYVLKVFEKEIEKNSDSLMVNDSFSITLAGGTSLVGGFLDIFKEVFSTFKDFPYEISEIRFAKDQLNSVSLGCLAYSISEGKKR